MSNDFKKKGTQSSPETPLDELLREVTDEQERKLLVKAWHALGGLSGTENSPPEPSKEVEKIFGKSSREFGAAEKAKGADTTSNAAKLYQMILSDKSAQAELARAGSKPESIGVVVRLGERMGLPVTPEEVRDFLTSGPDDELSDAELEMVVGGKEGTAGNDSMSGTWFGDFLSGGGGDDTMSDGGGGEDTMSGGAGNDSMIGGFGEDDMSGGTGNDTMHGDQQDDTMSGGAGNDSMTGGNANDHMSGDAGADTMSGDAGADTLYGGADNDSLSGGAGNDYLSGGAGNDYMDGGFGHDTLDGGGGDDTMHGGAGHNIMFGGAGNDDMHGNVFNDYLSGGAGNDYMAGDSGADTLSGDGGNDFLTGGAGGDTFVFGTGDGSDTIKDFNPKEDYFFLHGAASADDIGVATQDGNTVITYGQTTITLEGVEMDKDQVWARVQTS